MAYWLTGIFLKSHAKTNISWGTSRFTGPRQTLRVPINFKERSISTSFLIIYNENFGPKPANPHKISNDYMYCFVLFCFFAFFKVKLALFVVDSSSQNISEIWKKFSISLHHLSAIQCLTRPFWWESPFYYRSRKPITQSRHRSK